MNNATATSIREEIKTATVKTTREEMVNKEEVPAQFARTFAEAMCRMRKPERARDELMNMAEKFDQYALELSYEMRSWELNPLWIHQNKHVVWLKDVADELARAANIVE